MTTTVWVRIGAIVIIALCAAGLVAQAACGGSNTGTGYYGFY